MSKTIWLPGAHKFDLSRSRGNGPFGGSHDFRGVALHVNVDEHGTPDSFWQHNSGQVTPNFQVYKSAAAGGVHQMLPFNWQPWCQIEGNFHYAAIETAGLPSEPLTDYQLSAIANILRIYHADYGMSLTVTDTPGHKGLITHQAGGPAWGGHSCPGTIRAAQRRAILSLAGAPHPSPQPHPAPHPVPKPAPHGTEKSLHRAWPHYMGANDYFGLLSGPEHSRGGANAAEQAAVLAIKKRLYNLGYSGFDMNGFFGQGTKNAVSNWQRKVAPHSTTRYGEIWRDDWNRLFTY